MWGNAVTLHELSKHLNLSVSTVSRALSRPNLVSPETRQKVLAAASAYGFTPNAIARSLKNGRTQALGIVVSDIQNPFYSSVVREVERVAASRGYTCVICNADEDPYGEERALELLLSLRVAGILHASTGANAALLQKLQRAGVPLVDIDRASGLADVDTVLVDNALGARLAAEHLLDLGHRRVAVVTGPQPLTTGRTRLEGFQAALAARGVALEPELVEIANFREAGGYSATLRLLALPARPTALFVANNEMMAGALSARFRLGLPNLRRGTRLALRGRLRGRDDRTATADVLSQRRRHA